MINQKIKDKYELDWTNESQLTSNPHSVKDYINDTILHVQDILKKVCDDRETILDLGCGDGKYHTQFFPQYNFIGIEYIQKNFAVNKKNKYHIQDLNILPYTCLDGQKFKMILGIEIIEHLNRPDLFLENIFDNLLADNGKILIVTDNKNNIDDLVNKVDISIYDPDIKQITRSRWTHGHVRYFTVESIYKLFENVGFKIELMGGCGASNSPIINNIANVYNSHYSIPISHSLKTLGYALPQYCPSMYILASKK